MTERHELEWQMLVGNNLIEVHACERNFGGTNQTLIVVSQEVGLLVSINNMRLYSCDVLDWLANEVQNRSLQQLNRGPEIDISSTTHGLIDSQCRV